MNIKTITCHNVYNTGASLQAYALCRYLNNLGHEAEIIDYRPDYLRVHYRLSGVNNPKFDYPFLRECYQLAKLPGRIVARYGRRKRRFDRFTEDYLPLTEQRYLSAEELCLKPPKADIYFAGSDQIWNTLFPNGRDSSFYLQFAPKQSVRASYAASFATETISPECKDKITCWLHSLDAISVREQTGMDILQSVGIENGRVVLDPVFLISADSWRSLCSKEIQEDPYILVYDFDKNDSIQLWAKYLAKENGWKIFSIQKLGYEERNFRDVGPIEFLEIIRDAQFILSNSFHATAFSLIFQKDFLVFNRTSAINTRMRDLLYSIDLEDRLIEKDDVPALSLPIMYPTINEKMDILIQHSEKFITYVLNMGEQRE